MLFKFKMINNRDEVKSCVGTMEEIIDYISNNLNLIGCLPAMVAEHFSVPYNQDEDSEVDDSDGESYGLAELEDDEDEDEEPEPELFTISKMLGDVVADTKIAYLDEIVKDVTEMIGQKMFDAYELFCYDMKKGDRAEFTHPNLKRFGAKLVVEKL